MNNVVDAVNQNAGPVLIVLIIALVAYLALRIIGRVVSRVVLRRMREADDSAAGDAERRRRLATITSLVDWLFRVLIIGAAAAAVLVVLNLTPVIVVIVVLLAVAAVVARDVIRDYVGGFLIVAENQFAIGDWVETAGQYGEVERVSLRRTVLRSTGGDAVMIPNGDIRTVVNRTRGWARINLDIGIADPGSLPLVQEAIDAAAAALATDADLAPDLLEPPHLELISDISRAGIRLLIWGRVRAAGRFRVESEYRRLLLKELADRRVELVTSERVSIVAQPV